MRWLLAAHDVEHDRYSNEICRVAEELEHGQLAQCVCPHKATKVSDMGDSERCLWPCAEKRGVGGDAGGQKKAPPRCMSSRYRVCWMVSRT